MKRLCAVGSCLVAAALTAAPLAAEDATPKEETIKSSLSKDAKADPCMGACTINFRDQLDVPFDYLIPFGARIHEARYRPDPVGLAAAAKNLEIAEKIAGKTAKVTSQQVMDEAVRLAELRKDGRELKAVALLVSDDKVKQELGKAAAEADANKPEPGEVTKEIFGTLRVMNHTHHSLRIYCDGQHIGDVYAGRTFSFHVHAHGHTNHLDAYCLEDGQQIRHGHVCGHRHFVNWHIHE